MPFFGAYSQFPLRFGHSTSQVESLTRAISVGRGSALDVQSTTAAAWVENHAIARAIADVWHTNQRMGHQAHLATTGLVDRWESIFGIIPTPTQTLAERRLRLVFQQKKGMLSALRQQIVDLLEEAFDNVSFSLLTTDSTTSGALVSYPEQWTVFTNNIAYSYPVSTSSWPVWSSAPSAPACTMSGAATVEQNVQVVILSDGALGVATYAITYSASANTTSTILGTTASSVPMPGSGLTFGFSAGTYSAGTYYQSWAITSGPRVNTVPNVRAYGRVMENARFLVWMSNSSYAVEYSTDSGTFYQNGSINIVGQDIAIGNTGVTIRFPAPPYPAGSWFAFFATESGFSSTVADICVLTTIGAGKTEADYQDTVSRIYSVLDDVLPAWVCVHVCRDPLDAAKVGTFVLNDPSYNLNNHRLAT